MQQYFNRHDREMHITMMIYYHVLLEWIGRTKSLTKEELRYFKTSLTWLKKGYESMIVRAKPDYVKALKNNAKHCELYLEDTTGKKLPADDRETKTVLVDDIYDLADLALIKCGRCKKKASQFEECEHYKLFMKLGVPPVTEFTDECPYKQK